MSNTYFLAPFLPPIQLGIKPKIEKEEMEALFKTQLNLNDYKQFKLLKLRYELDKVLLSENEDDVPDFFRSSAHLRARYYEYVEQEGNPFLKAYFSEEVALHTQFHALRKGEKANQISDHILAIYKKPPLEMERAIIEYKIKKIDEWVGLNVFTSDAILAYAAKYYLNETILKWDQVKGELLLNRLEKGTL